MTNSPFGCAARCLLALSFLLTSSWMTVAAQNSPNGTSTHLADQLLAEDPSSLLHDILEDGDPRRGALVFFRPDLTCVKCHVQADASQKIGPDLPSESRETAQHDLVRSILAPSEAIKEGYETATIIHVDGKVIVGQVIEENDETIVLRDADNADRVLSFPIDEIEDRVPGTKSLMPDGLVNILASRQEFLDLSRYVIEVSAEGPDRAAELQPAAFLIATQRVAEYEANVDHAGFIRDWNRESLNRGEEIYDRSCINCHGTVEAPGSLPTSLRFASGIFKNGSDPFQMYQTLTHGHGLMVAQSWMVPEQKYDVIHYIREAYLKSHNPTQFSPVDEDYLAGLPAGTTRGPKPVKYEPWIAMDYGPTMAGTFEFGNDGSNFAYKGIAVRLDSGPGGVSRGNRWLVFDHDTMRIAGAWSGRGFIDWNGIHFNGRHGIHPRVAGEVQFENPIGPGWANPNDGSFEDPRLVGRDGKRYGPLPREWAHYRGMYRYGDHVVFSYTVGDTEVLEMPGLETADQLDVVSRTFNIGPRSQPMTLQVADARSSDWVLSTLDSTDGEPQSASLVSFAPSSSEENETSAGELVFDGGVWANVSQGDAFNMHDRDFTIVARIRTESGGTIFSKTEPQDVWVPDGKTLFVRGGRLCFDIGWVGVLRSRKPVDDGQWHQVAITYRADEGSVTLFVDGEVSARGELKPNDPVEGHHVRLAYTATDFPGEPLCFEGDLPRIVFFQEALSDAEIAAWGEDGPTSDLSDRESLVADWRLTASHDGQIIDRSPNEFAAEIVRDSTSPLNRAGLSLGVSTGLRGHSWSCTDSGQVRLTIPAGEEPVRFTLCMASLAPGSSEAFARSPSLQSAGIELDQFLQGGPPLWTETLERAVRVESTDEAFAVDVFEHPVMNPWQALVRLTGFDFFEDGDRMAVSSWDGDVWIVSGLESLTSVGNQEAADGAVPILRWKRIASGMFQPLGVKIVDGDIYITCRDQICILRDLNGDGETDFFQNFNNDHQVTEHFHEFAMGLQRDDEGNFYYAKSARHALTALVPHHGTLLRVSPDGMKTDIVANGFRAANGVCLNPDGSFIVTDQEGHWNPKNRINWVQEGGFYGNMFGYHDVTDSSDEAMEQPLCWITNAFDRSPAELLWVDSPQWGALNGQLLNLSYGYGKIFVVPHEKIDGQVQGGMCQLPIDSLPTGVMRGRFNPIDGQLYCCGMFAWAGSQTQPGGFYRLRYTGQPTHLPTELKARSNGIEIEFDGELSREVSQEVDNYRVKVWSLRRSANYGSQHYDEHVLTVDEVQVSEDGRRVFLSIPNLEPTWCMEIQYSLRSESNQAFSGVIHNTIHHTAGAAFDSRSNGQE